MAVDPIDIDVASWTQQDSVVGSLQAQLDEAMSTIRMLKGAPPTPTSTSETRTPGSADPSSSRKTPGSERSVPEAAGLPAATLSILCKGFCHVLAYTKRKNCIDL